MSQPQIQGNWVAADDSRNHIELAATKEEGVFAFRDTHDPATITTVTRKQVMSLADSVKGDGGRLRRLLGSS